MRNNIKKYTLCAVVLTLVSTNAYGHDTTHIHPLITSKIRQAIQDNDLNVDAYLDIYKLNPAPISGPLPQDQFLYWGTDFAPAPGLSDDLTPYVETTKNTINGVVHEDVPSINVLDHFYHATSGIGLTLSELSGNPSSVVAMAHFNDAIDWYGKYTEDAKGTAFFEFGRSLHHVEDMSSPAHVHNDPHLTFYSPERDDYEGYYLPMQNRATRTKGVRVIDFIIL